jgi:protein SCO1/2
LLHCPEPRETGSLARRSIRDPVAGDPESTSSRSLVATVVACLCVICSSGLLVRSLTESFELWTFEDARREHARQGHLGAKQMDIRTSRTARRELWSRASPRGDVMIVDFIYTTCTTVCQALGAEFSQLQHAAAEYSARSGKYVELMSLSIDPARDRATQLAAYGRSHRADDKIWTIAAPVSETVMAWNLTSLGIVVIPDGIGGFVHNGSIHVMTHDGKVLAIYDDADWREAFAFATRWIEGGR